MSHFVAKNVTRLPGPRLLPFQLPPQARELSAPPRPIPLVTPSSRLGPVATRRWGSPLRPYQRPPQHPGLNAPAPDAHTTATPHPSPGPIMHLTPGPRTWSADLLPRVLPNPALRPPSTATSSNTGAEPQPFPVTTRPHHTPADTSPARDPTNRWQHAEGVRLRPNESAFPCAGHSARRVTTHQGHHCQAWRCDFCPCPTSSCQTAGRTPVPLSSPALLS